MRKPGTRFHLIEMPWHALGAAPLALAMVRGTLARTHPAITVTEHYLNLSWAEYLLGQTGGRIGPQQYHDVGDQGIIHGLGDWVFAGSLYGDPEWRLSAVTRYTRDWDPDSQILLGMRALAGDFISQAARTLADLEPDVIGFTTTFMQNVPSLALARQLKQLLPGVPVIFGGANCDGPMGAALHRNHRFVDYVVRGEAELVLPQLMDRIGQGRDAAGLDGVCWWDGDFAVANPQLRPAVPPDAIPAPDYAAWHRAFTASPVTEYVAPYLVVEGSRGCWWGEKHHCTFCGLNDDTIQFRSKPAKHLFDELAGLVARYRILDVITSDNIMSVGYFTELLPLLAGTGWDLRIHYEMKANLKRAQIELLADAGLAMIQAGIESLSTRVLQLMDKGVHGTANVRVLRDCQDAGVSVAWNWLYGFPGETPGDYWPVIRQLPALVHLEPPQRAGGSRIALDRFSPYFERPELGFSARRPALFYSGIYDLPQTELDDLAYYFECDKAGIEGDVEAALNEAIATWLSGFPGSFLHAEEHSPDTLTLTDQRAGWPERTIELAGWQARAYSELAIGRSPAALRARLARAGGPTVPSDEEITGWLAGLLEQGLVFTDGGKSVALATRGVRAKLAVTAASR